MMFSFLGNFAVKSFGTVATNANDTALEGRQGRSHSHFLIVVFITVFIILYYNCQLVSSLRTRKLTDFFDYIQHRANRRGGKIKVAHQYNLKPAQDMIVCRANVPRMS